MEFAKYYFTLKECPRSRNCYQLSLYQDSVPLTFGQFFSALISRDENAGLVTTFRDTLLSLPSPAIFFEMPPLTYSNYNTLPFEAVLLESPELRSSEPDFSAFRDKFSEAASEDNESQRIVSFKSLKGDCLLISPCPVKLVSTDTQTVDAFVDFSHLLAFHKNADIGLIQTLWRTTAMQALSALEENPARPLWISTSGLGVSWLHVRLDTIPKYYKWEAYKT